MLCSHLCLSLNKKERKYGTISTCEPVVMISSDIKAFQSVTFQISTLFCNFITCFFLFAYIFVTVYKCMGAVNWFPFFCEFTYSASGISLMKEHSKWKEERILLWYTVTEASLQKARKCDDSWVWRSLGRYFFINHCIVLFKIMLSSKNKFNTVCYVCCFPECSSCDRISRWM